MPENDRFGFFLMRERSELELELSTGSFQLARRGCPGFENQPTSSFERGAALSLFVTRRAAGSLPIEEIAELPCQSVIRHLLDSSDVFLVPSVDSPRGNLFTNPGAVLRRSHFLSEKPFIQ